jgi:DNA-binding GntR family transcriptional regulator
VSHPVHQQIASDLRAAILAGDLTPGAQLPTEHVLAERYEVSRATARTALQLLVHDGLAAPRRPRGYFVHRPDVLTWTITPGSLPDWPDLLTAHGCTGSQTITVTLEPALDDVATALRLTTTDLVLTRRRIRLVNEQPYAISTSCYPAGQAQRTPLADPAELAGSLAAMLDVAWGADEDLITAGPADTSEAHFLAVPAGRHVLRHTRTSTSVTGRPYQVTTTVLPSDRWRLVYPSQR